MATHDRDRRSRDAQDEAGNYFILERSGSKSYRRSRWYHPQPAYGDGDMRRLGGVLAGVVLGLVVLSCAGARGAGGSGSSCALTAQDSAFLAGGAVYSACDVHRRARLQAGTVRVNYQPPAPPSGERCEAVVVRFVVDAAGVPETGTARVVHATDPAFGTAVLNGLGQWRYQPALVDGSPGRQIVEERRIAAVRVAVVPAGSARPQAGRPPRC
jgi:hypothetical protein